MISVAKQWWLKINTKATRMNALDGAVYPHVIKVTYTVDGKDHTKKWIGAGNLVPSVGSSAKVIYLENKPSKAKVL